MTGNLSLTSETGISPVAKSVPQSTVPISIEGLRRQHRAGDGEATEESLCALNHRVAEDAGDTNEARALLGLILAQRGATVEGRRLLETALEERDKLNPGDLTSDGLADLGGGLLLLGNLGKAFAVLRDAVKQAPENANGTTSSLPP